MKYHSKTMFLRCVSFFLFAVMTVLLYPVGTLALTVEEEIALNEEAGIENQQVVQSSGDLIEEGAETLVPALGPGEKSLLELQDLRVEDVERPEVVSLQAAMEKQHVNRLYAQEGSLNTVMFQNRDGSTTTYVYTVPVKYVSEDGSIKDKSTAITASSKQAGYAYAMEENDVKVYFGNARMSGVKVAHGEYSVTMKPVSSVSAQPIVAAGGNTALYEGVFGEGTAISYKTQLSGVKEDIVLYSNVGKNSFSFVLATDGLTPALIDGVWCLLDARDATLMKLGEILITDSAGNTTLGSMSIQANVKMSNYTLTVTAPQEFLDADTTVYPVYVDPTITISGTFWNDQGAEQESIHDMGVYQSVSNYNSAIASPNYHTITADSSQVLYRFHDFVEEQGRYNGLDELESYDIGKVTFYLPFEAGEACDIIVKPIDTEWYLEGDTYTAVRNSDFYWFLDSEENNITVSIPATAGTYAIDLTDIARSWGSYNTQDGESPVFDPADGFLIMFESQLDEFGLPPQDPNYTPATRRISAVENPSTSVYYTVDRGYGGYYYMNNCASADNGNDAFVTISNCVQVECDCNKQDETHTHLVAGSESKLSATNVKDHNSVWIFRYRGSGMYLIQSAVNPTLFFSSNATVGTPDSLTDEAYLWYQVSSYVGGVIWKNVDTPQVLSYDGATFSMVNERDYTASDYAQTAWYYSSISNPVTITLSSVAWMDIGKSASLTIETFPNRPVKKTDYTFSTGDSAVLTVNQYGVMTAPSSSQGGTVIITATHTATGLTAQCQVTVGGTMPTGVYTLQNVSSKNYMAVQNASEAEGALIQTQAFDGQAQMMWKFTPTEDGYYTIQSELSGKYLAVTSTSAGASVIQTATLSDLAKWQIDSTTQGNIIIYAKATGQTLTLRDGVSVTQNTYTSDSWYIDEWQIVQYRLPTSGSEIPYEPWLWNDYVSYNEPGVIQIGTNCYAYAMNTQMSPIKPGELWYAQPGEVSDVDLDQLYYNIVEAVEQDSIRLGFSFRSIGKYDACAPGTYKIALVLAWGTNRDYHWYRQNTDGTWSHKKAQDAVCNVDSTGNLIYDPETTDRIYYPDPDYLTFVGYFEISPVNDLYNAENN